MLWSHGEAHSEEAGCGKAFCLNNQMVTASNLGSVMSHVGSLDSGRENGGIMIQKCSYSASLPFLSLSPIWKYGLFLSFPQ